MKINNSTTSKKKNLVVWTSIVVALLLLTAVAAFYYFNNFRGAQDNVAEEAEKAAQQQQLQNDIKQEAAGVGGKPGVGGDAPASEDAETVGVTVTSPEMQSINNFRVRAFVDKATNEGSCTLTLTAEGKATITKTVSGLQPSNQISGCPDITVPSAELSTGTWNATVSYESSSSKGSASQTITVE